MRAFDQLIYNFDRNLGNLLIDKDWTIWMIDHTRAFKIFKDLKSEKNLSDFCEKDLLIALRSLDKPALKQAMEGVLSEGQIDALLARRDKIVSATSRRSRPGARGGCSTTCPRASRRRRRRGSRRLEPPEQGLEPRGIGLEGRDLPNVAQEGLPLPVGQEQAFSTVEGEGLPPSRIRAAGGPP